MKERILTVPPGTDSLLSWLRAEGVQIQADCGGKGSCGKCRVRIAEGVFYDAEGKPATGTVLACQTWRSPQGGRIVLTDTSGSGLTDFKGNVTILSKQAGTALDLGTTTLAMMRVGSDGIILDAQSALNPQRSFGADVISRIMACTRGELPLLQEAVLGQIRRMLRKWDATEGTLCVVGNPTMLHIFCGISPEGIGRYPFQPAFTGLVEKKGSELGLPVERILVLPQASAFIGSDITTGVLACGMLQLEEPSVLMDIGTNGEMVLCMGRKRGGELYCASAAAGPALEGAGISCGMGGVPGAVCRVTPQPVMSYQTIGDQPAAGLCGCGLIDLAAALLAQGTLEPNGNLREDYELLGLHKDAAGRVMSVATGTGIELTQQDVRELQLAKSALRAGLEALMSYADVDAVSLERVYIAGGLGYYIDITNAVRIGLLPRELEQKTVTVGNTALSGAVSALGSQEALWKIDEIAKSCKTVELSQSEVFQRKFIEHMRFPEEFWHTLEKETPECTRAL